MKTLNCFECFGCDDCFVCERCDRNFPKRRPAQTMCKDCYEDYIWEQEDAMRDAQHSNDNRYDLPLEYFFYGEWPDD